MKTIKVEDYTITPIYTQDILYVSTKLFIKEDELVEDITDSSMELIIKNRDVRDLYRKGKEESLAYTLLRPFVDNIMSTIKTRGFEWKDFLKSNEKFIPYMIDTMVNRIKEVMNPNAQYYVKH